MGLDRKRKMSISVPKSSEKKKKSIVEKKSSSEDSDEHSDNDNNRLIDEIKMGLDRNRKMSINVPKSSEKKTMSIVEKKSSSEDSDEHSDNDNELIDEAKNEIPVINRWPQNDIKKLLSQIEVLLPKNDNSSFRSRVTKLDWGKIQFDNYSKDECHSTWLAIQDQLRTFKTLGDLVNDAKALLATKGIDTYQSKQNRVQKPRSAYMLYYMEVLPKYRKKHPNLKLTQLTQIIAEKYKLLSPEKKQSYLDTAQKLKTEYQELIDKTNEGFKPKTLEPNKPKSPFLIFLETKMSNLNGQFDKVELQNHFKEKWERMSEKKKSKWIKLAQEREQIYFNNLKEDHKNDPGFVMPPKRALSKGDKIILESQAGKPKKPPTNNYGLFSKEMLQSDALDGVQPKDRMALLAQKWKLFSDEEKQLYTDRLKVLTERYKTEYAAYLKTLPEEERQIELAKNKTKPKKPEPKVVPRINAREPITEKPKKKATTKPNHKLSMFENEPKPVPYKNAFELYRSKLLPNEKHPIKSLEEWEKKNGRKKIQYEEELKLLKKEYMMNLKEYLSSLSEDNLKLYLQVRKPELLSGNVAKDDSDDSSSESENENSSSEEDDEDDSNNDDDDDDDSDTD